MKKENVLFQICFTLGMVGLLSFQAYAQTAPVSGSANTGTASNTQTQESGALNAPASQTASDDQKAVGPFDPISARILSDPLFLPLKGQFYGTTAYTFGMWRGDGFNALSGVKNYYSKDFLSTLSQNLAYGITNNFTVRIEESYSWENNDSTLDGSSSESSEKFWSNPTFGATYRLLDQPAHPVDVDFSASYTPNFNINGGYVASGLQMASLTASIGREMKMFSVQLTGSAQYFGVLKNTSLDEREGQYWLYNLGFNTQTRLTDRFSVNCGFNYIFPDIQKFHVSDGVSRDVWGSYMSIDTAFNYQVIPNRLVAAITYSYVPSYGLKIKHSNPGRDNENLNGLYENIVGARLQYLF